MPILYSYGPPYKNIAQTVLLCLAEATQDLTCKPVWASVTSQQKWERSPKGGQSPCPTLSGESQRGAAHQPVCCKGMGQAPAKVHQYIKLHKKTHMIKRDKNQNTKQNKQRK